MIKQFSTVAFFIMLSVSSMAQSADQIIEKYLEAIGGEDALRDLEGQRMTSHLNTNGIELKLITYTMSDGRQHVSYDVQGKLYIVSVFDGTDLWGVNTTTQEPEMKSDQELENMNRSIEDYPNCFLDYASKGYTVEMMDFEDVDGVDCYKIKLTKIPLVIDEEEVENVLYYYFDEETFLPVQVQFEEHYGANIGKMRTNSYADYQEVDGLYFPFTMIVNAADQRKSVFTIENLELNPEVEDEFFTFPEN